MNGLAPRGLVALAALLSALPANADHPLLTEDTEVLGTGKTQLQLHGSHGRDEHSTEISAELAHGITERADVQLEIPYMRERVDGNTVSGRGDSALALKWRFHERDRLSLAFLPELHLPTGRDKSRLGAGKARIGANLVAGYEVGRWQFYVHGGYLRNRNKLGERENLRHLSAAALFAASEKLKLLVDFARDTNPDPLSREALREAVVGAMYSVSERVEVGLGLKRGLNDAAEDQVVRFGVSLVW